LPELQSSVPALARDLLLEAAAINGLSHRLPYGAICGPGHSIATDRITVIAAMRTSARSWRDRVRPRFTVRCPP
jgi:hypothetical protein